MPEAIAVINASPLIFLAHAGQLDLLHLLMRRILIPQPVMDEISRRGAQDITVKSVMQAAWLQTVPTPPVPRLIQAWDLGPGESSMLAYAYAHPGVLAIVDDLAARRCAASLDIPCKGTLGLVLLAKQQGRIPAARPLLLAMRQAGMYLSDSVLNEALKLVDE